MAKNPRKKSWILFLGVFLLLSPFSLKGQFYNGLQMSFGKNRVQYNNFYWQFYRFDDYDVYFNQFGKEFAQYTNEVASTEITRIEKFFDYKLEKRLIFLVYNKLTDFRQSNIGLVSYSDEYNTGGVTQIINNKVFVYYNGNHEDFRRQIKSAIAEVVINEMLYGNGLRENVANSTLVSTPEWFLKGLISYVSDNWSIEIENIVKDGIQTGRYEKFNHLTGKEAVYAGHSFWKYIADTYGASVIPNIVYLTRINKSVNSGFLYVLGVPVKDLSRDWLGYYIAKYTGTEDDRTLPAEGKIIKKPKLNRVYQQVKLDPSGKYIAYLSNDLGKYKIWLFNTETSKQHSIFKNGHKLEHITDYSFPVLSWHPSGRILTFITEEKGGLKLYYYTLATKELEVRNLLYFEKVIDYSFSEDGSKLVLSAVREGRTDLYVHTLASSTNEQITKDLADDLNPRFINKDEQIIFSSNRRSDSIEFSDAIDLSTITPTYKLYIYDYKNHSPGLFNLSEKNYINQYEPSEVGHNKFIYLSDKSGIYNRYLARFDSTISFVDTTLHYRYYTKSYPVSNYSRNILEEDILPEKNKVGEIVYFNRRYNIFHHDLETINLNSEVQTTPFRKELTSELEIQDSLERIEAKKKAEASAPGAVTLNDVLEKDTILGKSMVIDINHYVFEQEKFDYYNKNIYKDKKLVNAEDTVKSPGLPRIRIYETAFYTNYMVNQVDFSFLNTSYQAFTGGAVYYNPGFNMLFKIGTNDLFEDYKLIGGVRFSGDFDSNEYLLSLENLKKRTDKQVLLHRQVFKNGTQDGHYFKTTTHQGFYMLRYPFSQVKAIKGTVSLRHDRTVFLSTDLNSLGAADIHKLWAGLKGEFIYDDTRKLGINLYDGTRYKIFAEYYKQLNEGHSDLWVLGADFRYYLPIHRNLIWANRFAASTSFGHSRLIYYLGSVDNWINIFPTRVATFNQSIPIDHRENYAYQTLATNMRGFSQNIRNGNNFAVINSEIRWPIIKYFVNRPMSSNFLANFQVIGFFDIGSAWTGLTPYSGKNAYDHTLIPADGNGNPITIILDSNDDPIVAGYGGGLRSQLFGYFIRLDWAWGISNRIIMPRVFYLSLNLDF